MTQMGKPERDKGLCVMEKEYGLSRVILVILALVIVLIIFQNEHRMKQVAGFFYCSVALLASFLGTPVSRKMIRIGDGISNILLRILYYVGLLVGSLAIAVLVGGGFIIITVGGGDKLLPRGMGLNQAVLIAFLGSFLFVFLMVPCLQTIIVLFLRKIFSQKGGLRG